MRTGACRKSSNLIWTRIFPRQYVCKRALSTCAVLLATENIVYIAQLAHGIIINIISATHNHDLVNCVPLMYKSHGHSMIELSQMNRQKCSFI